MRKAAVTKLTNTDVSSELAAEFSQKLNQLIEQVVKEQHKHQLAAGQQLREDIELHFCTLAEAMEFQEVNLFLDHVAWSKILVIGRDMRSDDLIDTLTIMQETISETVSKRAASLANGYIQAAMERFDSFPATLPTNIDPHSPFAALANAYLQSLLSMDRNEARKLIREEIDRGTPLQDIYLHVFEPVQQEIGRLWQMNQISVAQEHYCTAATEILMTEIHGEREEDREPHFFLGACVAGAHHSLGIRMLSELLEAKGWKVYFTGADTPTASLVDLVSKFNVDVLGISAASATDLLEVRKLVESVRKINPSKTKILVGGRIFNQFPVLWKKVGADGSAPDAIAAVGLAQELVAEGRSSSKRKPRSN